MMLEHYLKHRSKGMPVDNLFASSCTVQIPIQLIDNIVPILLTKGHNELRRK